MEIEKYFENDEALFSYRDKKFKGSDAEFQKAILESKTIYIGELCTVTTEEQLWAIFGLCGPIRRIIMGVNEQTLIACGFAFVEFYETEHARKALNFNGFRIDGCNIKVDIDHGFTEGRQYGRGIYGNQVKDDFTRLKKQKIGHYKR